ncbi:saccharopine dehydrogenase family protein [Paracoccus sp. p3-h83]|uniref:saccharopine dehydrogenase family protein n=1 Tax=Paracoccus sp. p3-h83 TaxID=3342805 RepID=UPI0035B7B380
MIHWCGTGLSAIPGLRRLIAGGHPVTVWNRTVEKARAEVGDVARDIRAFSLPALTEALAPGDVVVSMLPADQHPAIAAICVDKGAHFVSSSYISPEMRALDGPAAAAGVALVNEVGLDPGIDHLMAHDLVADYRRAAQPGDVLSFTSYCGGIPKIPNDFKYKFSWSPLGVLRALRSPSRSIWEGEDRDVTRPWLAVSDYTAPLPVPETFEVYPNRDSIPFIEDYQFDDDWLIRSFVRGTIRLKGWKDAWAPVFAEIETLTGPEGEARMAQMAAEFWRDNAYGPDDPDRVVLVVALKAEGEKGVRWHKEWVLDAHGDARGTAMARLVSIPVALAVEAVLGDRFEPGVHAAPADPALLRDWMAEIATQAQHLQKVDHCA